MKQLLFLILALFAFSFGVAKPIDTALGIMDGVSVSSAMVIGNTDVMDGMLAMETNKVLDVGIPSMGDDPKPMEQFTVVHSLEWPAIAFGSEMVSISLAITSNRGVYGAVKTLRCCKKSQV